MLYGYAGTILRVDLSSGRVTRDPLDERLTERFLGGRGLVAKLLWDELPRGIDPLGPDNPVIVATGPLTGHYLPASGKTHFGTKSPASGGYADSNMGGHFAPALKYAGIDALVLTGRAAAPCVLSIRDAEVGLRPAGHLAGSGALECERRLKDELGEATQIVTIGPAGERGVRYACISHDFGRQSGRTGIGAVLGAKNLKAIAVRGTGAIPVWDLDGMVAAGKEAFRAIYATPGFTGWTPEGTAGITDWINQVGAFPTRNFQTSFAEHHERINGRAILERLKITDKGCFCCPTPCGKYGRTRTRAGEAYVEGPEYESIALFGGCCALTTIEEVAYANYLCDELGLDTISAGAVIGWTIECVEKGILTPTQVGREVSFGDLDTVVFLLERIARREGIGDLLAEGVKTAAARTGGGSERFAIHVKGLEWTGYECRNAPSMMLAYMTADIGAHHNRAWVMGHDMAGSQESVHDLIQSGRAVEHLPKSAVDPAAAARHVMASQHLRPLFDALGTCRLQLMELGFETAHYPRLYHLATGRRMSWEQMLAVSERIWHLTRAINVREIPGFGRDWDRPPERFTHEPVPSGPNAGHFLPPEDIDRLLDAYYAARGWDADGIPTAETLRRQGLEECVGAHP